MIASRPPGFRQSGKSCAAPLPGCPARRSPRSAAPETCASPGRCRARGCAARTIVPDSASSAAVRIGACWRSLDDAAGDPAAESLFAVVVNDVGEVLLAEPCEQPPRRFAVVGVEPQVELAVGLIAEAAVGVGQLVARQAEVEQDAVDAPRCRARRESRESPRSWPRRRRRAGRPAASAARSHGVRDRDRRRSRARRAARARQAPACARRRRACRRRTRRRRGAEVLEHFVKQHGHVDGGGRHPPA